MDFFLDFIYFGQKHLSKFIFQIKNKKLHWQGVSDDNDSTNAVAKYTNYPNDDSGIWQQQPPGTRYSRSTQLWSPLSAHFLLSCLS